MLREIVERKIDIQATLIKFQKEDKLFPVKALEYENNKSIEKKLIKWATENKSKVVYKGE